MRYNAIMSKITVVLVDDHAVARAGILNALKEISDLEIVGEASDGPGVFAVLEQTRPDCLLIDLTMPNFEPISAIRKIRILYPAMKILVVSAYDDDIYVQGLLGLGVNGYHLKDQPLSDLRLAVQRVIAGERWVSSRLVDKLVRRQNTSNTPQLTTRQRDMLRLLEAGLDNRNIALQLGLSVKTVENHLTRLYRQINVQSRLEAVNYLTQHPQLLADARETTVMSDIVKDPMRERSAILLVDDNGRFRYQLRRMISAINSQMLIYEAENTQEALQMVQQAAPRLVFVDVVLGDESGIQCTRQLMALSPAARIVLISAYPDSEFHRLGLEAGAVAFLDKKILDTPTLRQVIEDVMR